MDRISIISLSVFLLFGVFSNFELALIRSMGEAAAISSEANVVQAAFPNSWPFMSPMQTSEIENLMYDTDISGVPIAIQSRLYGQRRDESEDSGKDECNDHPLTEDRQFQESLIRDLWDIAHLLSGEVSVQLGLNRDAVEHIITSENFTEILKAAATYYENNDVNEILRNVLSGLHVMLGGHQFPVPNN